MADDKKPAIAYDLASHHALGGGSYVFKSDYPNYLKTLLPCPERRTEINIIIQPNSSPHIGTICSLGLAFVVARRMLDIGLDVSVTCDLWDRAKGKQSNIDGMIYQKSLRDIGQFQRYLPDYVEILNLLSERYHVHYKLRMEEEFLSNPEMPEVLREIIMKRDFYAQYLAPETKTLAIRAACPECGLVEKYGLKNGYAEDGSSVSFECPIHGQFSYSTKTQTNQFQFNCQLFNLVLALFYERVSYNYIEICGGDYAGFWQEQLMWRFLSKPIIIVYTPLISDWSGSKISKSLYLSDTAYDYLRHAGLKYLLSYECFREERRDLALLWKEIELWVDQPYRLFRGYSVHYMHLLFEEEEMVLGTIHDQSKEPEHD
ncbi:uncharacterized protein TRIVIDRAFT_61434 [Trichoderma virens Gv29-8]|uniref:Uncharacterized protein n=1 Tax=Hypocrea virens (strain Gv29-8 / FGSC 10586) TaxID=413071 RepID=G9MMT5_HYPVG|nr:uncharacterized protein TRIVIDRAFT_61434 [Trichoderma virens Gv29-8]EHK24653.1 hypothetical protein TRIVIDRAFT_61434 [Trichoderma virens Gv29-8]UKZ54919.1 hypothetical protein TrVGV298_008733 [Trichoderma virens]